MCAGVKLKRKLKKKMSNRLNAETVRKGLQQGVFPWGYAVHTSDNRWSYFINAKRFAEVEGIAL